jgi:hypothetical protein
MYFTLQKCYYIIKYWAHIIEIIEYADKSGFKFGMDFWYHSYNILQMYMNTVLIVFGMHNLLRIDIE